MELAVYTVATGVLWALSATILLPFLYVLKNNKYLRDRWFSFFSLRVLKPIFEPKLLPFRKIAFDVLKKNLPQRDSTNAIRVLEIGIGSGANLAYYPENVRVTALDMNESFATYFRENLVKYPHIMVDKLITSYAEDMKDVHDNSMDVVISTFVLCSVISVEDSLKEIRRVLKPGGKFLFLEHVGFPKSDWNFSLQKIMNPLWPIYCDGCNLTRHLDDDIKNAKFCNVEYEVLLPKSLMLFCRRQICGLATK